MPETYTTYLNSKTNSTNTILMRRKDIFNIFITNKNKLAIKYCQLLIDTHRTTLYQI